MGKLQYDDQPSSNHTSVDYDASDFELACCGSDADCTPMPPQPGKFTQPWVRFAHASPTEEHKVDCVIELGGGKKEWDGFAYGVFSDWSGPFPGDTKAGNGTVKIYESTGGVRGALLATKSGSCLPPPLFPHFSPVFSPEATKCAVATKGSTCRRAPCSSPCAATGPPSPTPPRSRAPLRSDDSPSLLSLACADLIAI